MEMLLERLTPTQTFALLCVLCGTVFALSMIVAITKFQFQSLADDTALKRERQQAELAMRQKLLDRSPAGASLDALLAPEGLVPDDREKMNAELAKRFGCLGIGEDEIEGVLVRAMAADPARKSTIIEVMDALIENEASPAAILAAVRPLCPAPAKEPAPAACA